MINRSNYEQYVIDYLEGTLSPKMAEVMALFLQQNPDIQEELDMLDEMTLEAPQEVVFQGKQQLKVNIDTEEEEIAPYEQYVMDFLEGKLGQKDATFMNNYLKTHPKIAEEIKGLEKLILVANPSIIYPYKEQLKSKIINTLANSSNSSNHSLTHSLIHSLNYEEHAMEYLEGELDASTHQKMEQFLNKHPQIAQEIKGLEKIVLSPNTEEVIANKESLKQEEKKGGLIVGLMRVGRFALPLAAALAIVFFFWQPNATQNNTGVNTPSVVQTEPVKPTINSPTTSPVSNAVEPVVANNTSVDKELVKPGTREKMTPPTPNKVESVVASNTGKDIKTPKPVTREKMIPPTPNKVESVVASNAGKDIKTPKPVTREKIIPPTPNKVEPLVVSNTSVGKKFTKPIPTPASSIPNVVEPVIVNSTIADKEVPKVISPSPVAPSTPNVVEPIIVENRVEDKEDSKITINPKSQRDVSNSIGQRPMNRDTTNSIEQDPMNRVASNENKNNIKTEPKSQRDAINSIGQRPMEFIETIPTLAANTVENNRTLQVEVGYSNTVQKERINTNEIENPLEDDEYLLASISESLIPEGLLKKQPKRLIVARERSMTLMVPMKPERYKFIHRFKKLISKIKKK